MPSAEAREAESDFLNDWADFTRIGLTDDVAARAGRLAWKHDLRGYDAAQLAAALAWREATEGEEDQVVFACFDNDLRRAAAAEGLETWPVSTVIRNRVNLNRWSTTTSWGSGVGHRQTRASLDGVRGAGVKAVSPAKAGAERSDAP